MANKKKLSNPFSTGGGGVHFEAHVQASFVALMLTGGNAPCLPCWPIVEIKLQGKIDGFDTDDLIVVVENVTDNEKRKLLGQIKHSMSFTQGNAIFGEVIQAAWNDFNNPDVFTKKKDVIALITGPLSSTDTHNVQWLLNQARHTKNVDEFLINVRQAKFSPAKSTEKLEVIQYHLKAANSGSDLTNDELYDFLNHFHLLGYDLGNETGVVLSLLHSHIAQFHRQYPQWVWSRIVDIVQTWNKDAGTITPSKFPEDILEVFKPRVIAEIPEKLKVVQQIVKTDWTHHPDATYLSLAVLIGRWNEKNECDRNVLAQLLGISYDEWLRKAREILHSPDSPLSLKNGVWKVTNRTELWSLLGSRVLDQNLELFKSLAISVLKEPDPAFELSAGERYAASIYGKVLNFSPVLRQGIAEGLAIIGSQPEACVNCSQGNAEAIINVAIHTVLTDANWVLWGSLNGLLPTLAEAAPAKFLDAVEKAMNHTPCAFDELFSQEGNGITGGNYLTGLLWALEGLAWDEQYLVRVCVVLAELASHDPGGKWANRPSNSLATILLPWLPQTLASIEKRQAAVKVIFNEWPNIAWNLLVQLLPGHNQTSSGSHKPSWRRIIPDDWEKGVTDQDYWLQTTFYAELAVASVGEDTERLTLLIDHFDSLPSPAFEQLLEVLSSKTITELHEEKRVLIWEHLNRFSNKHRRFSDANWALPDELLTRIENVAEKLAPANPFNLYQHLFSNRDFDLYEGNDDWEVQRKKLEARRESAISEILQQDGAEGVMRFSEHVSATHQIGSVLGTIDDDVFETILLPDFLNATDNRRKALVSAFIWKRLYLKGWEWCDNLDKSNWAPGQLGQFLAYLPFNKETWARVAQYLQDSESEYWTRTDANPYQNEGKLTNAIDKLIEHGRPHAAINCLYRMHQENQPIDTDQCVRALLAALSSNESSSNMDGYNITALIQFLQTEPKVDQDDLFKVEWAYLPLLDGHQGAAPKLLENRMASDPEFFCEVIRLIYRSDKEEQTASEPTEELKAIASNAWRLLYNWETPPGSQPNGTFSGEHFNGWLQKVKEVATESGHLDVALSKVGEVLVSTPSDPDGLWINREVATALNDRDAERMREGYRIATYNSRGAHWVDPTGKPERELADQFRAKAEEVENAGFQRFAGTLRVLVDGYDREAERIISDQKVRDSD
ncbi:hypothetical protein SAMN05192562_11019 [Kosakonia arachidis]|uniref:Uncharacterized protein n=2 Tax=Kosakonia arachidis TaxID=551989 RepID=A0A1I7E530_9ENTR|nr:hypothetical protein [Kosakonia arachidis]SFU19036.1 hypothetical protein SAMN05192562_11019 [Kosakonia arachidis]